MNKIIDKISDRKDTEQRLECPATDRMGTKQRW